MSLNRRNILTVLGVAAVGTPAFASELVNTAPDTPGIPGLAQGYISASGAQEKFAVALEKAAAALRNGGMNCLGMEINSSVKFDDWMQHKVTFTFELGPEAKA